MDLSSFEIEHAPGSDVASDTSRAPHGVAPPQMRPARPRPAPSAEKSGTPDRTKEDGKDKDDSKDGGDIKDGGDSKKGKGNDKDDDKEGKD